MDTLVICDQKISFSCLGVSDPDMTIHIKLKINSVLENRKHPL